MIKPFIYLRKKILLPLRWRQVRKKRTEGVTYPPVSMLIELQEGLAKEVVIAKGKNNYRKSYKLQGKIDLIDWIINYASSQK